MWLNENFLLEQDILCETSIDARFHALRGGELVVQVEQDGQVSDQTYWVRLDSCCQTMCCYQVGLLAQVMIRTDNIDLAGEVVQSLAAFLRIENLQVAAHFPVHLKRLKEIMDTVRVDF